MVGPPPPSWAIASDAAGAREVVPGVWRLRLPLPWGGIPHVNAFTVDAPGGGIVLFDAGGAGDPSNLAGLEHALAEAGHTIEDVATLVVTHTHSDHVGLAEVVRERSGAPFYMHAASAHFYDAMREPEAIAAARERRSRAEGVPEDQIEDFRSTGEETEGVGSPLEPDVLLADGVEIETALGPFTAIETPGHAPSHVALVQRERGIAIVGDLLGAALYFDVGYTPDPIDEQLRSLDRLEQVPGIRVGLPGHGRPIEDVYAEIAARRHDLDAVREQVRAAVASDGRGAYRLTELINGHRPEGMMGVSEMTVVMACLANLRRRGEVERAVNADGSFAYRLAPT